MSIVYYGKKTLYQLIVVENCETAMVATWDAQYNAFRKCSVLYTFFDILSCCSFMLKSFKFILPSSIYTQYTIMKK